MKKTTTLLIAVALNKFLLAQLIISTAGIPYTIDFTGFNGSGFSATPSSDQLSSDTWSVQGFSDGNIDFGEEGTTGDFARGLTSGSVTEGGIYAADIFSNQRLMVQPLTSDFTPGSFTLRIKNETGSEIGFLNIAYIVYALNDQHRSGSFNFSYSADNIAYTDIPSLNFSSPAEADMLEYSSTESTSITDIEIADGDYFYLRWTGDDDGGIDSRDEFMLDDISVTGYESGAVVTYSVSPPVVIVGESDVIASFNVSLSESADCVLNINYTELTADIATDFSFSSTAVTFTEGGTAMQSVDVDITDDVIAESDENFIVYFTVASGICAAGPFDEIEIGIEDNDIVEIPIAGFDAETATADESAGSVTGTVSISASADCEVEISLYAASTLAETSDYIFALPLILTFSEGGTATQEFDIVINDDIDIESDETLILNLTALSGCTVSAESSYTITVMDNDTLIIPEVNIADVHGEDADGICTSIGDVVSLTGIVYGVNLADAGLEFTLIDETGGISVYHADKNFGYTVTEGDEINVVGTIAQFNGLTQIIADTVIFISADNVLKIPADVTELTESTESDLVDMDFIGFGGSDYYIPDPAQWLGDGSSFIVDITNGFDTIKLRIDNNTELSTKSFDYIFYFGAYPNDEFDIAGLGTQSDAESPYLEGYQLMPRYASDFIIAYEAITDVNDHQFSFYPNPAIDNLHISAEENILSAEIFDHSGRICKTFDIGSAEQTIDISELPAGLYTIKIRTLTSVLAAEFIKQ